LTTISLLPINSSATKPGGMLARAHQHHRNGDVLVRQRLRLHADKDRERLQAILLPLWLIGGALGTQVGSYVFIARMRTTPSTVGSGSA
jgi:hypothetical protein